jgi:VIT1/CCC1 family predicted Fe2+/Mn2+ transporter
LLVPELCVFILNEQYHINRELIQLSRPTYDVLPPTLTSVLGMQDLEAMRKQLNRIHEPPKVHLDKKDWLGAIAIFLMVFSSTFPVIIPFLFIESAPLALRLSNGIAIVMLFLMGCSLGRYTGDPPWRAGFRMVILGIILVGITIALGG